MDNRDTLMVKSTGLFAARGYEAVGVQEICVSSGVTKPTLYHYFGSKSGLLSAIVDKYGNIMLEYVRNAAIYSGDLPFSLEKTAAAFFRFARENIEFYRMKLTMYFALKESEANSIIRKLDERVFGLLEEMVRSATVRYGNIRGRERITTALFIGGINTCIGLWLNGLMELDEAGIRQSLRLMQYGIYT